MSIKKFALCEISKIDSVEYANDKKGFIKVASGQAIKPGTDKYKVIKAEMDKHPTALFFRSKAIKADEMNSNGDYFTEDELLRSYKSFEGVPFFTNHDNQNIENARGKVIHAEWVPEEKSVYVISFIDREAFPQICRSIEEEYINGVSMGAVSGGSMILMSDLTERPIEEIKEGDIVFSHLGNPRKVKQVHNEYLGKSMYKIRTKTYHRSPLFTNDHPVLTIEKDLILTKKKEAIKVDSHNKYERKKERTGDIAGQDLWRNAFYDAKFKHANCISEGDYVLIPSKFKLKDELSDNSDFYYLLGAFLGDGYLKRDKKGQLEAVTFCLGLDEIELCQKIRNLIKKHSDAEPHDVVCEDRNGIYISVYDRKLAKKIEDLVGSGSKIKRIKFPLKYKNDAEQLLAGYLDTDGCVVDKSNSNSRGNGFGGFQISSSNIGLLEDIQQLLISLGYISRISTMARKTSHSSVVNIDTIENTLAIESNAFSVFKNSIKYVASSFDKSEIKAGQTFITYIDDVPFMACPVKSVEVVDFREPVYDLTVDEDESYVADGLAVHNCSVEYSVCSICNNKAERTEDFCTHIRNRKGRKFTGTAKDAITGEVKHFNNADVFEYNYGIKFIELSAVVDPACQTCRIDEVYCNDEYLQKVAKLKESINMIKTSDNSHNQLNSKVSDIENSFMILSSMGLNKVAGQEEINQLRQVLETLEGIAVKLIQNRQQVEVEFASDLVGILSDLQSFADELIGAGYGNVSDAVPGVDSSLQGVDDQSQGQGGQGGMPTESVPTPMPAAEEKPLNAPVSQEVGNVSGSPSKPLVSGPELPITAPAKPMSSNKTKMNKVANVLLKLKNLESKTQNREVDDMGKRRTKSEKIEQKKAATKILSNSWQEKQSFFEYIKKVPSIQDNNNKLSVKKRDDTFIIVAENKNDNDPIDKIWTYEDLTENEKEMIQNSPKEASVHFLNSFAKDLNKLQNKEGENVMTVKRTEAGAKSVNKEPEVIQEAQLEETKNLYHGREDDSRNEITQKQLESQRAGEKEVITEKQLNNQTDNLHSRTNEQKEVITEAQLNEDDGASPRKDESWNEITQSQLDSNDNRVGEKEVVTEKQLDNTPAPWERAANRDSSRFVSAGDHMNLVMGSIADSVLATGCTPQEACDIAGSLVASTKGRYELGNTILEKAEDESVDYSKRLAYWSNKNIKVASVGKDEIANAIIVGLKKVASDETINPELVLDALDIVSESEEGPDGISKIVDKKLEEANTDKTQKTSSKKELRNALKASLQGDKEKRDKERSELSKSVESEEKSVRKAERKTWKKKASMNKQADYRIETSFDELGVNKTDPSFRSTLKSFANGALRSHNIKMASITNVTINGDTISIAVQTDEDGEMGESVEIPVSGQGGMDLQEEEIVPEGDMAGEGLENNFPENSPSVAAKNKSKIRRKAQVPMGGGMQNAPGQVAGGTGASEDNLPGNAPSEGEPVQSLTTDEGLDEEIEAEIPTAGEQQPLGSICPECGTSDVDITEENGNLIGQCNNPECGTKFESLVKKEIEYKILTPSKDDAGVMKDREEEAPEAPEVPALPVAAQIKIDKGSIKRIASNHQKHGHVCPACGMTQCKASKNDSGSVEYKCPACGTSIQKDIVIATNNPKNSFVRVKWDIVPNLEGCKSCSDSVKSFASMVKLERMMKNASNGTTDFPLANCKEYIAKKWGGNTSASFGSCKGQLLADCVCSQLQKLGSLRTTRHIDRLASVYTQKDPMEECIEDQKNKGFEVKEAENICNCLRNKFASSEDNPFVQAFAKDIKSGREKILTAQDLNALNDIFSPQDEEKIEEDIDITEAVSDDDLTTQAEIEIVAEEDYDDEQGDVPGEQDTGPDEYDEDKKDEDKDDDKDEDEKSTDKESKSVEREQKESSQDLDNKNEKEMAMAMKTHKLRRVGEDVVKVAGTPKKVEDIEDNVEAGVPRGKATMGNESKENIDVVENKPDVPRSKSTMGQEGPDNIDKPAGLPDVAVDSAYMGKNEKSNQSDMPAINNDIKGTVIAKDNNDKNNDQNKVKKEAKQLKEVDSVEDDVEAGVPRGKATMGNESKENIDVVENKPDVPRTNAEMGEEGADNINPKAEGPDTPVDSAYMGQEKDVQSDMPQINDKMLKQVKQENKKEQQLERISNARKQEAMKVAYKLMASRRISEEAFDTVVEALSNFEIDRIAVQADVMYPRVAKSNSQQTDKGVHSGAAIVMSSNNDELQKSASNDMQSQIESMFTIGNKHFDEKLTIYGDK